jgi:pimeloyl-ACP methyl ester carboxylesterase
MAELAVPVLVNGIAVWSRGEGPAIVLLHANGGDHRDFDAIVDQLAADHTVHGIDWPGHGSSTSATHRTAVAFARALPAVLAELPGAPFAMLGNSVGGFAAIQTAANHPELVRALILVAPGGFTPSWFGTRLACRIIASRPIAARAMRFLPRLYLRRPTDAVRAIRERAAVASADLDSVVTFASIWRSFTSPDHRSREAASRVTAPVLLTWGRHDPILPWHVDGRRARRAFPGTTIATFRCGHQPFAEMPDEFLAEVHSFLADVVVATVGEDES